MTWCRLGPSLYQGQCWPSLPLLKIVNSLRPSDPYMRRRTGSSPIQVMTWHRIGDKALPESMMTCCQFDPSEQTWVLPHSHYCDAIMGTAASQITSLTIVFTNVYSDADQSKHQSSASLAFVWGIHRGPVNSPHKWPVPRKMFPFDDVIMPDTGHHVLKLINVAQCDPADWPPIYMGILLTDTCVDCHPGNCMRLCVMKWLWRVWYSRSVSSEKNGMNCMM